MDEERRLVCLRRYEWLSTGRARSTCTRYYVSVCRCEQTYCCDGALTCTDCSCITIIIIKQRHVVEDVQLVESASPLD